MLEPWNPFNEKKKNLTELTDCPAFTTRQIQPLQSIWSGQLRAQSKVVRLGELARYLESEAFDKKGKPSR